MSYKQHPNAGKLQPEYTRYTIILSKDELDQLKGYAWYTHRKIKDIFAEMVSDFLDAHADELPDKVSRDQPKMIPCEVVGMNERSVKVATTDDHRWCLSLDVGYFGGEFPKMGERMSITMSREEA